MILQRYDRATAKVTRTPQGGIRVEGAMLKPGILRYRNDDGSERIEYRPPEETFRPDVMTGLRGAPVTDGHPPGMVDATTWRRHARGHVSDDVRQDGEFVAGTLLIQDADLLAKVGSRDATELSVGYLIEWDPTPGIAPDGTRYDGLQRALRPNHVAVVEHGRAGPTVSLRLDAAGNMHAERATVGNMKERIDGVVYEVGTPEHAAALVKHERATQERQDAQSRLEAERDSAKAQAAREKERADALEAAIPTRVKERSGIVREAEALGLKDLDAQTNEQLERAILGKLNPDLRLDGKDRTYVRAALDYARATSPTSFRAGAASAIEGAGRNDALLSDHATLHGVDLDDVARERGRVSTKVETPKPKASSAPSTLRGEN